MTLELKVKVTFLKPVYIFKCEILLNDFLTEGVHSWHNDLLWSVDYYKSSRSVLWPWSQSSRSNILKNCLTDHYTNSFFIFDGGSLYIAK